jgi:hypothetical protein
MTPFFSFSQTEEEEEEEIIPITRTELNYPEAMLVDWNSKYLLEAKKHGIELIEIVPMPCDADYDYQNEILPNPLVREFKAFNINKQDDLLSIQITIDQNCCSGFVGGISYFKSSDKKLEISLYEYGMECECTCCFSFDFKINVPEDFIFEEYDIDLSISKATLDLTENE